MSGRHDSRPRPRGFTLIELCVVVAIAGVLAALGSLGLAAIRERDALAVAPRQFIAALENARNLAAATGRDSVLVVVGNAGPEEAARCRRSGDPSWCVRYWILEDVVDGTSARFDDAALAGFDPAAPTALGDRVLQAELLPDGIFIGRPPGFASPPVDPQSIFAGLPLDEACSFCAPGAPPRGYLRFAPHGGVQVGDASAVGGTIYFSVSRWASALPDARLVVILQPSGMLMDRVGRAGP